MKKAISLSAVFGFIASASGVFSGCGPAVGEVRMQVRAARPGGCELQFVPVTPTDMMPGARFGSGGGYEMIGSVMIGADEGTDPLSPQVRALVRPRACAMGGEVVSLLASGTAQYRYRRQQNISFTVWAKRTAAATTPQPF